jgi:hypothetical protein
MTLVLNVPWVAVLAAADLPIEDDLGGVWPAQVEIVCYQRVEEGPGITRLGEDDRAGYLDLSHRALPPVPSLLVGRPERQREPVQPPLEEHLDGARLQHVADPLQQPGILAGREAFDSSVKATPSLRACCLAHSCPLTQIFTGQGQYVQILMNAGPKLASHR